MKNHKFSSFLFVLAAIFMLSPSGCNLRSENPEYYTIELPGAEAIFNLSKSNVEFGIWNYSENDTLGITVSEGDLLYAYVYMAEEPFIFRYHPDYGSRISFSCDTIIDAVFLNDKIVSIDLSGNPAAWGWIENKEPEELSNLEFIYLPDTLSASELAELERISEFNSEIYFEGGNDTLRQYLCTLYSPSWDAGEGLIHYNSSAAAKSNLEKLELVFMDEYDSANMEILYGLPKLNSLIISEWDSADFSKFDFDRLEKLRSLTIVESEIHDLSILGMLPRLKDLNIIDCKPLEEIGMLGNFKGLRSLGFPQSSVKGDVSILKDLPPLSRLSLAENTTQQEFSDIIASQNALQVLELINTDRITDLSPLNSYTGLKSLMLVSDTAFTDYTPLYHMKDLELLVIGEYDEDSLMVEKIQNALPDTKIVLGGGICLGSGWILLLIPLITLLFAIKIRYKRSGIAGADK